MNSASLASATGTRVDSSSKHIIPVRISTDHMLQWCNNDNNELLMNKHKYAMHKDDIVLSVGRDLFPGKSRINTKRKAYPPIVTNLANIDDTLRNFLAYLYHNSRSWKERADILNQVSKSPQHSTLVCLPDFVFMGVALGQAYAHPMTGDTVASSMIGGLRTILNGGFHINAGDFVQWYFDFEETLFEKSDTAKEGYRKPKQNLSRKRLLDGSMAETPFMESLGNVIPSAPGKSRDSNEDLRKDYYARQQGADLNARKTNLARIKTFRLDQSDGVSVFDRMRVFGRAISSARPYEMVDIMISRQAI